MLRRVGDLTRAEAAARVLDGVDADAMLGELERRAPRGPGPARAARSAGSTPPTPACTATRSARRRPAGCRRRSSRTCPTRCRGSLAATRPPTARSRPPSCARATASTLGAVLRELERDGELVRGELRPGGTEREWCDPEVLRRLRRASLAVLRKEIEPADQRALARFLPALAGRRPPSGDRRRRSTGCARRSSRSRGWRCPAEVWERDVLPRRVGAYSPAWMDQLCASGELVWIGAGALGRQLGPRRAVLPRGRCALLGPPPSATRRSRRTAPRTRRSASGSRPAPASSPTCSSTSTLAPEELQEALWDLVWAGEATNDAFAPLRAPRLTLARAQRDAARRPRGPGGSPPPPARGAAAQVQGRWSLTAPLFRDAGRPVGAPARAAPSCCSSATGS